MSIKCIRSIKRFQNPFIRSFIFDSNSWNQLQVKSINLVIVRTKKTKGDVFELLYYILHQIQFFIQIGKYLASFKCSITIVEKLDLQLPELELINYKIKDGDIWALQCKYHSDISKNVS